MVFYCYDIVTIQKMLIKSPIQKAEEWAIHDYDGFGFIRLHENESLETVAEYAEFIAAHGNLGLAVLENFDIETASTMLEEHYQGVYDSEVDFAWYLFEECYSNDIPENLKYYFDYAAFARDLFISDYFLVEVDGQTHVFSNY